MKLPMVCVCRDEGRQQAADDRKRAVEILKLEDRHLSTYVSQLVAALQHGFGDNWWSVEHIAMDQWFGILVTGRGEDDNVRIECDTVEDGLTAIFLHLYDQGGFDE